MKKPVRRNPEREAQARLRFLKKVIVFAVSVASERGRKIPCAPGDFAFRKIWSLCDFGGFDIDVDTRQAENGGNDVRISRTNPQSDETRLPVFHAHWVNNIEGCRLIRFDPNLQWQVEILTVMRNKKNIGKEIDRANRQPPLKRPTMP